MKRQQLSLNELASVGLNTDRQPSTLPPNAFTTAHNIDFVDGYSQSSKGYEKLAELPDQSEKPLFIMPYEVQGNYYWIVCTATKIWSYDGSVWSNVTGGYPLEASENLSVTGVVMGDVAIINDGVSSPRYWVDPVGGGTFQDLPFDETRTWRDMNYSCRVMRVYKQFLIALAPTEAPTTYNQRVWWSDPAPPGTVPTTWDYADPTNLSGYMEIAETSGYIVDAAQLGQSLIILKNTSTFAMTFSGGQRVQNFRVLNRQSGAIAANCIATVKGQLIVLGDSDIFATDGVSTTSIVNGKVRKVLFQLISPDDYEHSFVAVNTIDKQVYFCVPAEGQSYPSSTVVWNYKNDTFSVKSIAQNTTHMAHGIINADLETFNGPPDVVFDEQIGPFGSRSYSSVNNYLVSCVGSLPPVVINSGLTDRDNKSGDDTQRLVVHGRKLTAEGESIPTYLERIGIPLQGQIRHTTLLKVYPHLETIQEVKFYLSSQEQDNGPVKWEGPFRVGPDTRKFSARISGSLHGWRMESTTDNKWRLSGLDFEYAGRGKKK